MFNNIFLLACASTIFISKVVGDENAKGLRKTRLGLHDVQSESRVTPNSNPTLLSPGARRLGNGQSSGCPGCNIESGDTGVVVDGDRYRVVYHYGQARVEYRGRTRQPTFSYSNDDDYHFDPHRFYERTNFRGMRYPTRNPTRYPTRNPTLNPTSNPTRNPTSTHQFYDLRGKPYTYTGDLKDGKPNGWGTAVYASGAGYSGKFKDGIRHGIGKLTNPDGGYYKGEWENGKKHGSGAQYYYDGTLWHDGLWQNGLPVTPSPTSHPTSLHPTSLHPTSHPTQGLPYHIYSKPRPPGGNQNTGF